MDPLRFYTNLYDLLRQRKWLPNRLLSPFRYCVRKMATYHLAAYFERHPISYLNKEKEEGIIVTLTSFPARIDYVWLTIQSLLRQSIIPGKVVLWLSLEQFPNRTNIPRKLLEMEDEVFSIQMVSDDIRSFKKYYYALQRFPEKILITVDDDSIYSPDLIDSLFKDHLKYPKNVISSVTKRFWHNDGRQLAPYIKWIRSIPSYESNNLVQIGFGGVLYPPHSLHEDALRRDLFMKLCPKADDLWLNCMARRNSYPIMQSSFRKVVLPIEISNNVELTTGNWNEGGNDIQLEAIRNYYLVHEGIDYYK